MKARSSLTTRSDPRGGRDPHAPPGAPTGTWIDLGLWAPPGAPLRPVRAWLPAKKLPNHADRPALVLLDGQNVFGDHGSFAGGWRADEAVAGMGTRRFRPPLILAVANGGAHRHIELGKDLPQFLIALAHELLPRLRARLSLPVQVTLGGSSLGGLAALVGVRRHPEVFGAALAMSPSLWFAHRTLLHELEREGLPARVRVYLDAGRRERGRMFTDAEHLARVLQEQGLGKSRLLWRPDSRGAHHERHWRRRLPRALRFLFPA